MEWNGCKRCFTSKLQSRVLMLRAELGVFLVMPVAMNCRGSTRPEAGMPGTE